MHLKPLHTKTSKPSKIAPKVPPIAPTVSQIDLNDLRLPQICHKLSPIIPPIVPNVPENVENDPIINNYPTENNLAYLGPLCLRREGRSYAKLSSVG